MKFKSRFIAVSISIIFFLILAVLSLTTIFRNCDKFSYFENRNLTEKPEYTKETVMTGKWFTEYEKYLADHAAGRNTLIKLNTKLNLLLNKPVVNDVVVNDDCLLPYLKYTPMPDESVIEAKAKTVSDNLLKHKNSTEAYGGHFCYVAVPCQYVCLEDKYPWYLNNRHDITELSSNALFNLLKEDGIDYIDMYEKYKSFSDEEKMQFTSEIDNHFSIYGAYDTYIAMMEMINGKWNGNVKPLTEDEFTYQKVPNRYIGSRNRKLFYLWSNDESIYYLIPNKEIAYKRYYNDTEVVPYVYKKPDNLYSFIAYTTYMGGDSPRTTIDTGRDELPSILIYGDSFTNAVESIAWYSFNKMDSVDFRYYKDKTLDQLINELKPDYVFCIRDYEQLIEDSANGN